MSERNLLNLGDALGDAAGGTEIDVDKFSRFLLMFYAHWRKYHTELWAATDIVIVATPSTASELNYSKSTTFSIWLFGIVLPGLIMIFSDKQLHLLCNEDHAKQLEVLIKSATKIVGNDIVLHVKEQNTSIATWVKDILRDIDLLANTKNTIAGYIANDAPTGRPLEIFLKKNRGIIFRDVTNGFADLFSVKDRTEVGLVAKAAYITDCVIKTSVMPRLVSTIKENGKVSHSSLMYETVKAVEKSPDTTICYPPIFQSGGKFNLGEGASSNSDFLVYNPTSVIICAFGSRCSGYCSNIARTFLICPTDSQTIAYSVLLKAHDAAILALKPGSKVSAAYQAAIGVVQNEAPELIQYLTPTAGSSLGVEFRESLFDIDLNNNQLLRAGMIFNISIGFQDIPIFQADLQNERFSLLLADTVLVIEDLPPEVLTSCSKTQPNVLQSAIFSQPCMSKQTLQSKNSEHLDECTRRNEENARNSNAISGNEDTMGYDIYRSVDDFPRSVKLVIQVDTKHEAILVPIYGSLVPFHISTVKKVTRHEYHKTSIITVFFNVPESAVNSHASAVNPHSYISLKSISFRSKNLRHSRHVVKLIKDLHRLVALREAAKAERDSLVTQQKLQLTGKTQKAVTLQESRIRPSFGGRGRQFFGVLEAHINGFRYCTPKSNQHVDIMYGNIRHAFFQSAHKENIVLIHFHLHNEIMVGKNRTSDVQFAVKVVDNVKTLGGRKTVLDPDETQEECREKEKIQGTNSNFRTFVDKVHEKWRSEGFGLEFLEPIRELGFNGSHHNISGFIVPTRSCLVQLIDVPFLVVTLNEIEIVNLERVVHRLKNFDMIFVFKDFKKTVCRIDCIPSSSLQKVKEWLQANSIKFYQNGSNLNWCTILQRISDDPQEFADRGGWECLNNDETDSESDNVQDELNVPYVTESDVQSEFDSSEDNEIEQGLEQEKEATSKEVESEYSQEAQSAQPTRGLAEICLVLGQTLDTLLESMQKLLERLPRPEPLKECFLILQSFNLNDESELKAIRFLQKGTMAETFIALPEAKRLWWLQKEIGPLT